MAENKTAPTKISVDQFLSTVSEQRQQESRQIIKLMEEISGYKPAMWGPSIIGFGSMHYKYDSGREGDMPILGFSPRKATLTIYFEGFDRYGELLKKLGKHKTSVACLYINKLEDVDQTILRQMLTESFEYNSNPPTKPTTVEEYLDQVPSSSRSQLDQLRQIVKAQLPDTQEVLSYNIIGYKIDDKRARVYISGWKDHVALYPTPKDVSLQAELKPYTKGKGTLRFPLDQPLPRDLIIQVVKSLISS